MRTSYRSNRIFGFIISGAAVLVALTSSETRLSLIALIGACAYWMVLSEVRGLREKPVDVVVNDPAAVRVAMEDVRSAIVDELGNASRELHQALDLIRDAVTELGGGFNGLSVKAGQQNSLLNQIMETGEAGATMESMIGEMASINRGLGEDVSTTVRSLQFEDILSQLLNQTKSRLTELQQITEDCTRDIEALALAPDGPLLLTERARVMRERLVEQREKARIRSRGPALQKSMAVGDIELF